eukprot:16426947-Heterocapsa_arctica.AAC.1
MALQRPDPMGIAPPPDGALVPGDAMGIDEPIAELAEPHGQRVPLTPEPEPHGQRVPLTPELLEDWVNPGDIGDAAIDHGGDTGAASSMSSQWGSDGNENI